MCNLCVLIYKRQQKKKCKDVFNPGEEGCRLMSSLLTYFWSEQRDSAREGQVEDGVRVALLRLVTDGSRPMGEISDS